MVAVEECKKKLIDTYELVQKIDRIIKDLKSLGDALKAKKVDKKTSEVISYMIEGLEGAQAKAILDLEPCIVELKKKEIKGK